MLTTNVDKLLDILKEKKEVMVSDLALMLNTTPSNIEKIAKLLEEEKLLTIRYKMMKPYLVYGFKEKKKKKEEKEKELKKPFFVWKKEKEKEEEKEITKEKTTVISIKKKKHFLLLF